jgi:catalase
MAPSNLVPGIEPSEDRLLQGRLFAYADTQLHRVGVNGLQLPVNRPRADVANHNQDGAMNGGMTKGTVNYEPSAAKDLSADARYKYSRLPLTGTTQQAPIARTRNFAQAGAFYRSLPENARKDLIANLAGDLGQVKDENVKYTMLSYFQKADPEYGRRIALAVNADPRRVEALAARLAD